MIKEIYDKSIRVICPRLGDMHTTRVPRDIEGTLLTVVGHSEHSDNLIGRDKYLKLIYEGDPNTEFVVRFDNDSHLVVLAEQLLLRDCGVFNEFTSIWEDGIDISDIIDRRPYYELLPLTRKSHIAAYATIAKYSYKIVSGKVVVPQPVPVPNEQIATFAINNNVPAFDVAYTTAT